MDLEISFRYRWRRTVRGLSQIVYLFIHFSGYQGRYILIGRNTYQVDHHQIPWFEIDRIHKSVAYKASIHKYFQQDNNHHQSIDP